MKSRLLETFKFLARISICSKIGFSIDIAVFTFGILSPPINTKSITKGITIVNIFLIWKPNNNGLGPTQCPKRIKGSKIV
ncbi:conserved hypothetical protein [delta proteobacterium NaphS2]|nr:conserved hypothetical protein [delta proteobacterium NaphS2]